MALATTQLAPSFVGRSVEGRYRIEAPLGDGGMGYVYRARHIALDRPVALKVLRKAHNERWVSRKRFEREGRALGQLVHPNIVSVTDFGMDQDAPFLVMELLSGQDLARRLRAGALPLPLACRYALEMLDGLAFVHERGLVHRDIKPANVFLESTALGERVKLLDFGLARLVTPSTDATVTRAGEMLGTPFYMAPEQVSGDAADARTDVYAMGHVLFEMLAGKRAFVGSEMAVLHQHMVEPMPSLPDPQLAPFDSVIQRATEKDPAQRFADARSMRDALASVAAAVAATVATGSVATASVPAASAPTVSATSAPTVSAPSARAPKPRPQRRSSRAPSGVMRVGAVLVSCIALTAILIACSVIYLVESPGGKERRALLQRVLSTASDTTSSAR
jgi:serine/threonine-protein kinase